MILVRTLFWLLPGFTAYSLPVSLCAVSPWGLLCFSNIFAFSFVSSCCQFLLLWSFCVPSSCLSLWNVSRCFLGVSLLFFYFHFLIIEFCNVSHISHIIFKSNLPLSLFFFCSMMPCCFYISCLASWALTFYHSCPLCLPVSLTFFFTGFFTNLYSSEKVCLFSPIFSPILFCSLSSLTLNCILPSFLFQVSLNAVCLMLFCLL